jgi:hypothetical protein
MFASHVIDDEVECQRDSGLVQRVGQFGEVAHRAELRTHRSVVQDGIAAVIGAGPGVKQGHQVQVGDAQLLQVADVVLDASKRSGESVRVAHVTDLLGCEKPIGTQDPLLVQLPKGRPAPSDATENLVDDSFRQAVGSIRALIDRQAVEQIRTPARQPSPDVGSVAVRYTGRRAVNALVQRRQYRLGFAHRRSIPPQPLTRSRCIMSSRPGSL